MIWVIHPEVQVIEVIRADGSGLRIRPGGELSGEDVVPGFRCPVASLFPAARPSNAAPLVLITKSPFEADSTMAPAPEMVPFRLRSPSST